MDIHTSQYNQTSVALHLSGRLDANTAPDLKSQLQGMIEQGVNNIIIDMEKVQFIDSSGLSVFVGGLRLVREKNGRLSLTSINQQVHQALKMTHLDQLFTIYTSLDDALADMNLL